MSLVIRKAKIEDASVILRFVKELARYEEAEQEVTATVSMIEESIFSKDSTTHALICERGNEPIGFAVYFFNYSTWQGKNGLYLEDLYVSESERGSGAGKRLLGYLAHEAIKNDCGRFEWNVLHWNEPAIQFYKSLGAVEKSEWRGYQLTGESLLALAETAN
ncbi:GNAT family N-acetyltransferase [Marinomonas posidonica]|uniref:GCN5-related N-acetyltransferase n=1 Tax=Marinomonas posidonica (strain CECT 7376 / NCIMB 14433 / IVIA-Po-181) TaxID=491952 RepID=F6CWL4_MARPP|nr:GNAT family N-acetyltransferase [Marinomonas posidonica]AEF54364.1 GCN5-related N-acetyltransferase [Marinomonas posidonica IVIA-Po-181]